MKLRLWPGVVAVTLQWMGFLLRLIDPALGVWAMLGAVVFGLVVVVWWLVFSRAPWWERVGALALIGLAVVATRSLVHPSISNAGLKLQNAAVSRGSPNVSGSGSSSSFTTDPGQK